MQLRFSHIQVNIDRTLTLAHAAPTCGEITIGIYMGTILENESTRWKRALSESRLRSDQCLLDTLGKSLVRVHHRNWLLTSFSWPWLDLDPKTHAILQRQKEKIYTTDLELTFWVIVFAFFSFKMMKFGTRWLKIKKVEYVSFVVFFFCSHLIIFGVKSSEYTVAVSHGDARITTWQNTFWFLNTVFRKYTRKVLKSTYLTLALGKNLKPENRIENRTVSLDKSLKINVTIPLSIKITSIKSFGHP